MLYFLPCTVYMAEMVDAQAVFVAEEMVDTHTGPMSKVILENLPSTLSVVEEMVAASYVTKSEVMLWNLPSTLSVVEEVL